MGADLGSLAGYSTQDNEEHPLAGYAALMALYNALFAGGLLLVRTTGRKLPERFSLVATFRLSRLISKDSVTSSLRAPFTEFQEPAGSGEINERPRGTGLRKAVGELLTCPFCVGQWVASALAFGTIFASLFT